MQKILLETPIDEAVAARDAKRDAQRDEERRAYREKLAAKLKDPAFRAIEGFPHGSDEAILALSDPPYYTACPNPFLAEWLEEHGKAFDAETDEYSCEPFASDVSEGKNDPIYNAHSYHTKVPHKAIMRYILHYTQPGDVVYDGFCGTGMTGVAAQLCGDKTQVESLGLVVRDNDIFDREGRRMSTLGARKAILNDLSPAATFISANYNLPVDARQFEREAKQLLAEVESECGWMYATLHNATPEETEALAQQMRACRDAEAARALVEWVRLGTWEGKDENSRLQLGRINYTVWSDIFLCSQCGGEIIFWEAAVTDGEVQDEVVCQSCCALLTKKKLKRATTTVLDKTMDKKIQKAKREPVVINFSVGKPKIEKALDSFDLAILQQIEKQPVFDWYPTRRIDEDIDLWYERDYRSLGIFSVDAFFQKRNLIMVAFCHREIMNAEVAIRGALWFWFQSVLMGFSLLNRYLKNAFSQVNRILSGTLYVGSMHSEVSPWYALQGKLGRLTAFLPFDEPNTLISTASTAASVLPRDSIDYIFTDPPFGSNLIYSDLNILWESWLKLSTNTTQEAVIHRRRKHRASTLMDYSGLMTACFATYYRVLKPGRWMTVEFHNSANAVWNSIQEGLESVGFVVADIRVLDKQQSTFKQVTSAAAVKSDLVISCYKPRTEWEARFSEHAGEAEGVAEFLRGHLEMLPVAPVTTRGQLERVAERTRFLLFDRMVAYHLQRSARIPLSAGEFYALLAQQFVERDGMYFLPEQAARYDARRVSTDVEPLSLFVKDERSAVQWVRARLNDAPRTLGELTPEFMQELATLESYEQRFELRDLLRENFIEEDGAWRVPDPDKERDIEALRRKGLLRIFETYVADKGTLKNFRKEAIHEGFAHCWKTRQYAAIVHVSERIPEKVLREIHEFTQFYDIAKTRDPEMPAQLEFEWE